MDTQIILKRANEAFFNNFFKSLLSLVVFSVLTILLTYFIIIGFFTAVNSVTLVFGFILVVWFYVIFFTLQYGLMITVFKMTGKQKTVLGDLFSGFKKFRQVSGAALLTFAGMFVLNLIILTPYTLFDSSMPSLFTYSLKDQGIDLELEITLLAVVSFAAYGLILLFFSIFFAFVPYIFEQNPALKVLKAYKGCFILLKGRLKQFLLCIIKGTGLFLGLEIVILVLTSVNIAFPLPSFLMKFLSFGHTITVNLLLLKSYFVFASYYLCLYEQSREKKEADKEEEPVLISHDDSQISGGEVVQ